MIYKEIMDMICWLIFLSHIHLGTGHTHYTRIFEPNNRIATLFDHESAWLTWVQYPKAEQ